MDAKEFALASTNLYRAINLIQKALPDFYQEMQASIHEIVLAKPSGEQNMTFHGVSSFALWGALCLNVEAHQDWRAYIPSLIHEYSHNILFAKAMNGPLVNNDPSARYFSPLRGTMRPMDGLYHAAFVSAREVYSAEYILKNAELISETDLLTYLVTVKERSYQAYTDCLVTLNAEGQLSESGKLIMESTKDMMQEIRIDSNHHL
jgi:HEXXH motif-containing protein